MIMRSHPFFGHIVVLRLENIALRHQMAVYKHTIYRLRLSRTDRLFAWLTHGMAFVQPRTVTPWQKNRFRWRRLSQ
jgi:hypothetical protein